MPVAYVFPLGPIPTGEGESLLYLGVLDGVVLPVASGPADVALAALRRGVPAGTALWCAPDLAVHAKRHGFAVGPLPPEVAEIRAHMAFVVAHVDIAPELGDEFPSLAQAAARFWAARPWERRDPEATLHVTVEGHPPWEGVLMGSGGEEFGVALYPRPGDLARLREFVDADRFDDARALPAVSATLAEEPAYARAAIEAWCGLPRVPILFAMQYGEARAATGSEVLAVTGALAALAEPGDAAEVTVTIRGTTVTLREAGRAPRRGTR